MKARRLPSQGGFEAIFFDLDGTLVDTAPDMVAVLSRMQIHHRQEPLPYDLARNSVSNGAIGLLRLAFPQAGDPELKALHAEYLENYSNALCVESDLFPSLRDLLETLNMSKVSWGIVTNKPKRMTDPLLEKLGIVGDAACVVSGDTLAERKPHPAPLLHAAEITGVAPGKSIYIGDALRDIEAGRAAGMATVAVGYGYITDDDDPHTWGADEFAADTMVLGQLLLKAVDVKSS
jgi:phosphoglycolate phosphatase